MTRILLLLVLPLATGCAHSHGAMTERVDAGVAHEEAARAHERKGELPAAAERFAASHVDYEAGLEIAKVRENHVFSSFITTKLSIVSSGQARCLEPKSNPQGTWAQAIALYVQAAEYADRISMLKLKANAIGDQARCTQPDHDPQGSWERAAGLYAQSAEVCQSLKDDLGRGAALRQQALCLMKGDASAPMTDEARALLVLARKLGDEQATAMLTASGSLATFCNGCGADRREGDRFCRQCGRDQTLPPPGTREQEPPAPPRGPGAPLGPGGATPGGAPQ